MKLPKRTRFERLKLIYEQISSEFAKSRERDLQLWGTAYGESLSEIAELLGKGEGSPSRAEVASGMEQGLRDVAIILREYPKGARREGLAILSTAVDSYYPEFFDKDRMQLERVIERGTVRTEGEWYLVRSRVDQIEGIDGSEDQLAVLYGLLDEFQGPARDRGSGHK